MRIASAVHLADKYVTTVSGLGHTRGMTLGMEGISRAVLGAGGAADSLAELGAEISRVLGEVLPHDGYECQAGGLDPVTGPMLLSVRNNTYSPRAGLYLVQHCRANRDLYPPFAVKGGLCPVATFGSGSPKTRRLADVHEIMTADGVGADLRIALTVRGRVWGGVGLVRERAARPFTPDELGVAEKLHSSLTAALQRFLTKIRLNPARGSVPGTVVLDRDDHIAAATEAGRGWLRDLANYPAGHKAALLGPVDAARAGEPPEITVVPTSCGWATVHAQLLDGDRPGDVAVTIQPASSADLLSVMAVLRGVTPRENTIIEYALDGLSTQQIASQLRLSPHTVNDHFKAIHRKVGVTSREELLAVIGH